MYFNQQLGAPSSPLQLKAIREAYGSLYSLVGASKKDHFVFTSSGAEAVNHAVFATYLDVTRQTGKNHFLCVNTDEAPAILALSRLQELGCVFQMVPVNQNGVITPQALAEMLTPRTAFFSMSAVNGLTGVIQPFAEISELCKERGIVFHLEATHLLGKGDLTLETSGADILTFSGYQAGMGGLFFPEGKEMSPFILGGDEQAEMRGGAFSYQSLIELAQEAQELVRYSDHYCMEVARLRALFEEFICDEISEVSVLFQQNSRVPHITSLLFPGVTSDALGYLLEQKGVYATFGGNRYQHLMHVLKACGVDEPDCHCGLSFAFSHHTTEEEIQRGAQIVIECVRKCQTYSNRLMEASQ